MELKVDNKIKYLLNQIIQQQRYLIDIYIV